jgi:hypothetical protein
MKLKAEENCHEAFDNLMKGNTINTESGKKKAPSSVIDKFAKGVDENTENESGKKPAAKKQKLLQ